VSACEALNAGYKRAFKLELKSMVDARTVYVWGGANAERGVDCSGAIYDALHRAGVPVKRTTAREMARGADGWFGLDITYDQRRALDIIWWTFKPGRPHGHVGVIWDQTQVFHASASRGHVVVDRIVGVLRTKISKLKRLMIGG